MPVDLKIPMGRWLGALSQETGRDERVPSRRMGLSRTSVQKCDAPSQEHEGLSGWKQRPSVCACVCACVCDRGPGVVMGGWCRVRFALSKVCSTAQHAPEQDGRQGALRAFEKDLNWY